MLPCIIIPVHNRRETTLECLRVLTRQDVFQWAKIVIVDDGSTDGTAAAIRTEFPEAEVVPGSGELWWGGGINAGMEWAIQQGTEQVIWLNDDTHPHPGALALISKISRERGSIVTAQCVLRETGEPHYGGMRKTASDLEAVPCAAGEVLPCDTICGNCVCIPAEVIERIGMIDTANLPHFGGDADLGLRAKAAGVPIFVAGDALCDCSYGSAGNRQSWLLGQQSIGSLWANCFHPRNGVLAHCGRVFRLRHWGLRGGFWLASTFTKLCLISVIRFIVPRRVLLRIAGRTNDAHQRAEAVRQWEAAKSSSSS